MTNIIIRKATLEDSAEITNVHINSWKESYYNLIPKDYLDNLHLSFHQKYLIWKSVLIKKEQVVYVAQCPFNGIIGFISASNGRDLDFKDHIEIRCLYLLQKYQGQKVGFLLLQSCFNYYSESNLKKAYLWVLKNNPSILFYKKTGAQFTGKTIEAKIANKITLEFHYLWNDISLT
ncbi:MAG: hypothetical protein COB02_01505 [Candidatus Cloacimonadota bacterium]|nr:MAG: hypothetical protein COB02_01505 [Candidatus Cloacimonadota bacterium]